MVPGKLVQGLEEFSFLELLLGHVVELDAPDNGSLLNVGVNVIQTFLDSLLQVLSDSIKPEGTQASQGESSDLVVVHLLDVHPKGVDGKDCQLLVLLSVVN